MFVCGPLTMTGKLGFLGAPLALPTPASVSRPSLCRQGDVRMSSDKPAVENKAPQSSNKPAVKDNAPKSSATWANVWLPEFPRKGAGSVIGWDLRPTFFRPEPEAAVCDNCEGTGKIVCTICNGNDFMGPDGIVPCNACQVIPHVLQPFPWI